MKKFFSILCAIAIVFGANAAQVSKKDVLTGKVAKKEIRSQHATKLAAQSATFKAFDQKASVAKVAPKATKHVVEGKAVAGIEKKAVKTVAIKAPQAKKEVIDFTFSSDVDYVEWADRCDSYGYWDIYAENDDFAVEISNLESEAPAGSYAWEDLDANYSYVKDLATSTKIYFTDGSCTVSVDETDGLLVVVEGSFTGTDENTYNITITFAKSAIVPGDYDFEAISESHKFYSTENDVWYQFEDAEGNTISFDIIVAEGDSDVVLGQEYTLDDMLANYCGVDFDGEDAYFESASFVKTVEGKTDKYVATATDEYGRIFHLTYEFSIPEALNFDTITAEATVTKEAYWFWYLYTIEAADEANAIVLQLLPDDTYYGTWVAGDEITGAVTPLNGVASKIYSGEVTIEATAEGALISGKVLCMNNTEYTLNLLYTKPDPTRQDTLVIEGLDLDVYATAWQLSGYNEDSTKYVSIAAYSSEVSGDYTTADLAADYSYIVTDIEGNTYNYFELLDADLHVVFNEADSTIVITGTFVGQNDADIPAFDVTLSGKIPATEVSDMTFEFTADEEGITVTPSNDEDAWDWYVVNEATFEYYGADYIAEAIYGNYGDSYAVTGEQTLTFAEDLASYTSDGGVFFLVVWGAGSRNVTTEAASFEFEVEGSACTQYDAEEGNDFIVDFAEFEIDDQYFAQYGVLIVEAQNEDNQYLSLEIVPAEGATTLLAGEYPVSVEGEAQSVVAGELDLTEGQIYGSFAGNLTTQGINVPLWLIIEGTVTVDENGVIFVDAINCAGAVIKCQLGEAQGIEDTNAAVKATKRVVKGQFIIEKNGVLYNAQGAKL